MRAASYADTTIVVLAKAPEPGRVKTRLIPAVSSHQAAELAAAALTDTLHTVLATPARRRVLVLDGRAGPWLPAGFDVIAQCRGGLDERLAAAFARTRGPTVLVGMDTPQLVPDDLLVDFGVSEAWLGPSNDGGFWLVGMKEPDPSVFPGVPMSTEDTCEALGNRFRAAGTPLAFGKMLRDVDTFDDAAEVAALVPDSRFGREFARITRPPTWPDSDAVYESALRHGGSLRLVASDGRVLPQDAERWRALPDAADLSLLARCQGTTLDVGCGPGRFAVALAARGQLALGVDVATAAVAMARQAGAAALCRSVFDPIPGEGRWDTVMLADGNLGLDGDPARLLSRLRGLLRLGGRLLVEPIGDDADDILTVQLCDGTTGRSAPFTWGHLGSAAAQRRVVAAGYHLEESWAVAERRFLSFRR